MRARWMLLLALAGCEAEGPAGMWDAWFDGQGVVYEDAHANVVRAYSFTRELEPGVAEGFDLDGVESPEDDVDSCGHGDFTDPEGRTGVDNQLAAVWGPIEAFVGEAVEGLLQGAVNEGRLLLMVELTGVDDLVNDDSISVHVFRGALDPEIGTLGLIAPDQTYDIDTSIPVSTVLDAAIVDGVVDVGPVEFSLPIDILEANFVMDVGQGRVRFEIDEDGTFHGLLGGSVNVDDMLGELLATDAAEEVKLVEPFFRNFADMAPVGGVCSRFSVAFGFEGTTGFVVHPPEE